ncbi:MAG: dihydrofolate reductase, partial [Microbacterium sp.]|nr:dihydrofolate reductase [Microbacterium sp.]
MSRTRLLVATGLGVAASVVGIRLLLSRQAAIARRRIGKPLGEDSLDADRVWRRSLDGRPVELLLLGDSLAAGLGAETRKQTLGGRLAKALAGRMRRPVRLRTAAVVGSESPDLDAQLAALPADYRPHVAVIVIGGNDVVELFLPLATRLELTEVHEDTAGDVFMR